MNKVQTAIKEAIGNIPFRPYGRKHEGFDEGATKNVVWTDDKKPVLFEGTHSSCVYAVMEALVDALRALGLINSITEEQMQALRPYCFVYSKELHKGGIAAGLVDLGIAKWIDSMDDVQYGDFAQIWHENDTTDEIIYGHSCIIEGLQTRNGRATVNTWSSEKVDVPKPGHAHSWYNVSRTHRHWEERFKGLDFDRTWYVARIDPSLLLDLSKK